MYNRFKVLIFIFYGKIGTNIYLLTLVLWGIVTDLCLFSEIVDNFGLSDIT